jgi:hypothetical protein
MRNRARYRWCFAGAVAALSVSSSTTLFAQAGCCAGAGPTIVYGIPPLPVVVPPTGYVLDPSDARKPIYVVNQGPFYSGPGIYAVPTYSEGGYAYTTPYPYVKSYWADWQYGYGARFNRYMNPGYRPYGYAPYGAYVYRTAPSARVIHIRERPRQRVESEWVENGRR